VRGRLIIAVLALAAFCASFGAPLQPLFAGAMACCPSGKASACCKRSHHGGAGWTGDAKPCGSSCACVFPSSDVTAAVASPAVVAGPNFAPLVVAAAVSTNTSSNDLAFLFQRPPPTCA